MIDLEILHDRAQENTNSNNKKTWEDFFNFIKSIYVVYTHDKSETSILKAFVLKNDAIEYQRYFQLTNFKKCEIQEIDLE